jgi:hypothetical protein
MKNSQRPLIDETIQICVLNSLRFFNALTMIIYLKEIIKGVFMNAIVNVIVIIVSFAVFQTAQAQNNTGTSTSIFTKKQVFDNEGVELYDSNLQMKQNKMLGLGLALGGSTGLIGLNAEVNMTPEDALFVGMGAGQGYNTFNVGYKRNFEGYYLSPYTKVGFSKWFSSNSQNGSEQKSDILKQVLTEKEARENKFNENFITGAAGIEYNQLEGELSGVNFYGELVLMGSVSTSKIVPTGSVGIIYFY